MTIRESTEHRDGRRRHSTDRDSEERKREREGKGGPPCSDGLWRRWPRGRSCIGVRLMGLGEGGSVSREARQLVYASGRE